MALLDLAGLADYRDASAIDLPMGAQKLLEVIRALMAEPRVLLLDEPAAGLNDSETGELAALLRAIRDSGVTLVVVEHNMNLVMGIADQVIVLDAGRVIASGAPARSRPTPASSRPISVRPRGVRMLEVRALVAGYGRSTALDGVDLTVGAGEIVTLVGANGAGKSTLLKSISGLLPARSGEISFEGGRIDQLSPRARVRLGIVHVPEGRQIFVGLSVLDNLRLGAFTVRRTLGEAGLAARLEAVCERFPVLRERLHDPVGHLSGGQQQMLALARGLMAGPRLLLLDEPSLGLGPRLVSEMFKLVVQLRDGRHIHTAFGAERAHEPRHRQPGLCHRERPHRPRRTGARSARPS